MDTIRKLSFSEAWESFTIFYVDDELENEVEREVEKLIQIARQFRLTETRGPGTERLAALLHEQERALEFILYEIGLSVEKFLRIVSLLRRIGKIPIPLDREWTMKQVLKRIQDDPAFAAQIADLLLDGVRDPSLRAVVPRYYLELLNFREIATDSDVARRARYKHALIGTYSGRKGYRVEARIRQTLETIREKHGVGFESGRSRFINTNIDFAVPSLDDPWVIVMSSFQETTSSAQSAKARDMLVAYQDIQRSNARYGENRVFVNFVDGGGWLARKRDFQRLVESCHYFINLQHLDMLEPIVLAHVPRKYLAGRRITAPPELA